MKSNGVLLAVEDKLSDAVATKILKKRRDRGSIETDTTPDRRGRFPTKIPAATESIIGRRDPK